jgi:hypothetical protein
MAKVGILTFQRTNNYGASLQAYALRKSISELGYICEVIDYGKLGQIKKFDLSLAGFKPFVASVLIYLLNFINKSIRQKRFKSFRISYIKMSKNYYSTKTLLRNSLDEYEIFCTGSDQVWNFNLTNSDLSYLLDFVQKPKKKFSYAASFGIAEIPDNLRKIYSDLILDMDHVSVRETYGQKLIRGLGRFESVVVLDPVFLITRDQWIKISRPYKNNEPYILCYIIMDDPPGLIEFCQHLSKITGFKIIRIQNPVLRPDFRFKTCKTAGPLEFIGLIKNASLVVTNSFHGMAMSIIFEKPFYTFLHGNERDIRTLEIADSFKLMDRIVTPGNHLPKESELNIDYSVIRDTLKIKIDLSMSFLQNALIEQEQT